MGNWPDFGSRFPGWTPFGPLSTTKMSTPIMAPGCKALRDRVKEVRVDPPVGYFLGQLGMLSTNPKMWKMNIAGMRT